MQGSDSIPTPTHGAEPLLSIGFIPSCWQHSEGALFNAPNCIPSDYHIHFFGELIDSKSLLIPLHLRPVFQQEASRMSHSRRW